jgi:hypothetical protein
MYEESVSSVIGWQNYSACLGEIDETRFHHTTTVPRDCRGLAKYFRILGFEFAQV